MEESKNSFLELNSKEITNKLIFCARERVSIHFWEKGQQPEVGEIIDAETAGEPNIKVKADDLDDSYLGKDYYVKFSFQGLSYFSKGKVVEMDRDFAFHLEFTENFYRQERRSEERLRTYPHINANVFLNRSEESDTNVFMLNPHKDRDQKMYEELKVKADSEKLLSELSLEASEIEHLIGFRIVDISRGGLSFLANKAESNMFELEGKLDFILELGEMFLMIKNCKIVYKADYVDRRFNTAVHKISISINPDDKITNFINDRLNNELNKDESHDFENLV